MCFTKHRYEYPTPARITKRKKVKIKNEKKSIDVPQTHKNHFCYNDTQNDAKNVVNSSCLDRPNTEKKPLVIQRKEWQNADNYAIVKQTQEQAFQHEMALSIFFFLSLFIFSSFFCRIP